MIATRWKVLGLTVLAAIVGVVTWFSGRDSDRDSHAPATDQWDYNEHGVPDKRSPTDPKVAHIVGRVVSDGSPVAGAQIEGTLIPTGMAWTIDDTTSHFDGTFLLAIRSGSLDEKQTLLLDVQAGRMRGRASVSVAPGEVVRDVTIHVGTGLTVRGRVIDDAGAAVSYGVEPVHVCLGMSCTEPNRAGLFTLTGFERGRHRLRIVAGGITHVVSDLPLMGVAPRFVIDRLSGTIDNVVVQVDGAEARRKYANNGHDSEDVGMAKGRVTLVRGGSLPGDLGCWTAGGREHIILAPDQTTISVPVLREAGRTRIVCESDDFQDIVLEEPDTNRIIDLPLMKPERDPVDVGVELRSGPAGARVVDVADEAKAAGLQRGDTVTAIDGISLAGMSIYTVRELGVRLPPGHSTTWTIRRGTKELSLSVAAPAN